MNRSPVGLGLLGAGAVALAYGSWRWVGRREASVKVVEVSQPATFTPTPTAELPEDGRVATTAPSPASVARLGRRRPTVAPTATPTKARRPSVPGAKLPPRRPDPV